MPDIFSISKKPQIDGSMPLLKNGIETVCPKTQPIGMQNKLDPAKIDFMRLSCNDRCPFMQKATRTKDEVKEEGVVLLCNEKHIFVPITEIIEDTNHSPIFKLN